MFSEMRRRCIELKLPVDLILRNGAVHTMDRELSLAEAIAVRGSRILAVGSNSDFSTLLKAGVRTLDLGGRVVVPGFIDSHLHILDTALLWRGVNLTGTLSLQEVLHRVREEASQVAHGNWIMGWGWNQHSWADRETPTKGHLDAVCPDKPVLLRREDGHSAWLNSLALEQIGVKESTPAPPGGLIARDPSTGEPTGILYDTALFESQKKIPMPDQRTLQESIRQTVGDCVRLGLTGLHDATWLGGTFPESLKAFQALRSRGELEARILVMLPGDALDEIVRLGFHTGFGDELLRLGPIKLFADGSLCSQTALLCEPYIDQMEYRGLEVMSRDDLRQRIGKAVQSGISAAVHAIGDCAIGDTIRIFEEFAGYGESLSMPLRIEHASLIEPSLRARVAMAGWVITAQPLHIPGDLETIGMTLGEKRCSRLYALRENLDAGIHMAFGSDSPVADKDPLKGIFAAVTRQNLNGYPEGGWHPKQCITVEEAVWCYTMGSAIASRESHFKGSLTPGKAADMVVLSKDIFQDEPSAILETQVDMTIFDGRIVWAREE